MPEIVYGLFRLRADGVVEFTDRSSKYPGRLLADVAKEDPGYVWWAWRDRTTAAPDKLYDAVERVMRTEGVPFSRPKKKA